MNNVVENYLSQEFGLQTGKNLQTYGDLYPNQRLLGICSHGAQYISAKIEEKLPKSNNKEINEIIKGDRPIALIANRDSYWVGNGQAWRDSKINEFIPTIEYLLGKGYSVIRINSYSEPLQYASPFYLDFSGNRDLTANDQILVARKASILVGGDTGIVGVCQMLSHLPTLLVNGADWRPHVPWGNVILAPKHLEIKDKSKIRSLETGNILEFIFPKQGIWSYDMAESHGLSVEELSPNQILEATKEFIEMAKDKELSQKLNDLQYCASSNIFTGYTSNKQYLFILL